MERPLCPVKVAADRLTLFGAVASELTVFPDGCKPLEFETRYLMIWCIGRLFRAGVYHRTSNRSPTGREDFLRCLFIHDPQDLVHPVDTPIA